MANVSNIVKSIQDIMRKDAGTYGDAQRLEQLGWMFFLKIFDDRESQLELFPMLKTLYETQTWQNPPSLFQMGTSSTKNQLVKIPRPDFNAFLGSACCEFIHMNTRGDTPDREATVNTKGTQLAEQIYTLPADELQRRYYSKKSSS